MRKALKLGEQDSTEYSTNRSMSINSETTMKQSIKALGPLTERGSSESRKSPYFRMTATNSFERSTNKAFNNSPKAQQHLPDISRPNVAERDGKNDKKKMMLTTFSDSQSMRIAPNNSNKPTKNTGGQVGSQLNPTVKPTLKHLQPTKKDQSPNARIISPTDAESSPLLKKMAVENMVSDSDSPKKPSYLKPTIARIQAQRARPAHLGDSSKVFHFARSPDKPVDILAWNNRDIIEGEAVSPHTALKIPQAHKGQGSPTFSPVIISKHDSKAKNSVHPKEARLQTPTSPNSLPHANTTTHSNPHLKLPGSKHSKPTGGETQHTDNPNQDYFASENVQKDKNSPVKASEDAKNMRKSHPQLHQQQHSHLPPPQQHQNQSQHHQTQHQQHQSQQPHGLQSFFLNKDQAPKYSFTLKREQSESTLSRETTATPMPRLIPRLTVKTVPEDDPTENKSAVQEEEEETPYKTFQKFWEKEASVTEDQKKEMLFQPANINFFRINNEAPILVTMNSNNKMVEKNEVLAPKIHKDINSNRKNRAILATFGEKNKIIQPDYMQETGSMCFTDLWSEKQKSNYFAAMRSTVKQFKVFKEDAAKSQWDSVYRPEKIRQMQEINKKITVQNQQDAANKGKQEEVRRSLGPVEMPRRPSVFLSTENTRNRIADTFGDVGVSFFVKRTENSPLLSPLTNSPNNRRLSRWANQSENILKLDHENEVKSYSEEPPLQKKAEKLEPRLPAKLETNNDEDRMVSTEYESSSNGNSFPKKYAKSHWKTETLVNDVDKEKKKKRDKDDLKAQYQTACLFNKTLLQIFGPKTDESRVD